MPEFTTFRLVRRYFNHISSDPDSNGMWFVERINGLRWFVQQPITTYEQLQHELQQIFRLFGVQDPINEIPDGYIVTYERVHHW